MKKYFLLLVALAVGLAGQKASATMKTYIFEGQQGNTQLEFTGYFYNEASPSTHYNCSPSPWTYGTTGTLSFTLADGITLTLSSSTNKLFWHAENGLAAQGEATLTVSGGSTYYIYRVRLLDGNGNVIQLDANGMPVNSGGVTLCDYLNTTKSFSQTYTNSIGFKKIQISYATNIDNIAGDAYQGSGTENDPYIISSTSDLDLLAKLVNAGNDFSGKFFQQSADITYTHATNWNDANSTENNYTAIGYRNSSSDNAYFQGTYDGGGHTISGIRIYRNSYTTSDDYQGLFGRVYGTVKRVNLADTRITGWSYSGGIVGGLYYHGIVEDCTVGSDVCFHQIYNCYNHGGIVGFNNSGTVRRCISKASITVKSGVSANSYGGIVGYTYGGNITDCIAVDAVIPNVNARGAIVGALYNDCTLNRNYYYNCRVGSNSVTPSGVGVGNESSTTTSDVDGAQALYAITLGPNVTLNRSAEATLPGTNNTTYENGADINGQPYAYPGATVSLGYSGSVPEGFQASYAINGTPIEGATFEMPDAPVTISATLVAIPYSINLPSETPHGTVTSDKATSTMGETVTLTAVPETGYALGTLTVMNGDSPVATTAGENGTYTFEMPAAPVTVNAEFGLPIDSINFPDANFRSYLLSQSYGNNAILTDEEIADITQIYVAYKSIADLTGIEHFTALKWLYCNHNQLTALDVSQNTALTTLECSYNQITSLDVSQNTALTTLECYGNQITSLDVSHNTALTRLLCNNNQLTALDVSHNTSLEYLQCYSNQLTALDVSQNTALTFLDCGYNQLTALDVSHNTALEELHCYYNQLTVLDVSHNTALEMFQCCYNQLTMLDVSQNTALTYLDCGGNQLTALDVSHNTALNTLGCYNNQIYGENMAALVACLPTVDVDNNYGENGGFYVIDLDSETEQNVITTTQVTTARGKNWNVYGRANGNWEEYDGSAEGLPIDSINFPDANFRNCLLEEDYGSDGMLTDEEIASITQIDVAYKDIADLTGIEHFTALTGLYCGSNQLTSLDVSHNTTLTSLHCQANELTVLDVSHNTALTYLDCSSNQITALDVSQNTALTRLYCSNNQLTALDVSRNTALTLFFCVGNQLTSLDVSHNTALTQLYCSGNQLQTLDVSHNTELTNLYCSGNQLTALDVCHNTALTYLDCSLNQIYGENMAALVASLPTVAGSGQFYVINLDSETEQNVITTTQVATARGKNWTVYGRTNENGWQEYDGSEPVNTLPGDANGSGTVDVNDVTTVINYILSKNPDPFIFDNANVNGDTNVDVNDVTMIINMILGIIQ